MPPPCGSAVPSRVATEHASDVIGAFRSSVEEILRAINIPLGAHADVRTGDARNLRDIPDNSIAAVMTSPPYLNGIDYIRGHWLSLVWLGESLGELRSIRSSSIGAERSARGDYDDERIDHLLRDNDSARSLPAPVAGWFRRFAGDMDQVFRETHRVLEVRGRAILAIGNSTIRGVPVDNAKVVVSAAQAHGLVPEGRVERELPPGVATYHPLAAVARHSSGGCGWR